MTNLAIPILTILLLAGCAQLGAYKDEAKQKLSLTADTALADAVWWACEASSIGALRRKYGKSLRRASTYRDFCQGGSDVLLLGPMPQEVETYELTE